MSEEGHCGHCHKPLPENAVSDYWCSQDHYQMWSRSRSDPLDQYWQRYADRARQPRAEQIPVERFPAEELADAMDQIRQAFEQAGEAFGRIVEYDHMH